MKQLFTILILLLPCLYVKAQVPVITPELGAVLPSATKIPKHAKYKRNLWRFTYDVVMKNGKVFEANSEIQKDTVSGKVFLFYSTKDSTIQIFPEQTLSIKRNNPDKRFRSMTGYPEDGEWLFLLSKGKINSYTNFNKGSRSVTKICLEGNPRESFTPQKLAEYIGSNTRAMEAFNKKSYDEAIRIFNDSSVY